MSLAIFDSCVIIVLANRDTFQVLERVDAALVKTVTNIVDEEITACPEKYEASIARYRAAVDRGLLRREHLVPGSDEYAEYLRLRATRTNPRRDRGEDSCIALALKRPGSVVYLDDGSGANRARRELGDPSRVRSSADL